MCSKSSSKVFYCTCMFIRKSEICGFSIGIFGIGQKYWLIRVLVSVSDRNQNSGFGRSLASALNCTSPLALSRFCLISLLCWESHWGCVYSNFHPPLHLMDDMAHWKQIDFQFCIHLVHKVTTLPYTLIAYFEPKKYMYICNSKTKLVSFSLLYQSTF